MEFFPTTVVFLGRITGAVKGAAGSVFEDGWMTPVFGFPGSHGQHPSTKGSPRASMLMPRGEMPNGQFSPIFWGFHQLLGLQDDPVIYYDILPVDNDHNDHAFDHNIS
jgi:hypothetical protein